MSGTNRTSCFGCPHARMEFLPPDNSTLCAVYPDTALLCAHHLAPHTGIETKSGRPVVASPIRVRYPDPLPPPQWCPLRETTYSCRSAVVEVAPDSASQLTAVGDAARATFINRLADLVHRANYHWWHDRHGTRLSRNKGELIALMHSELSECLEGERKGLADEHLPEFSSAEVELADVVIRILDYCGAFGYRLGDALVAKLKFNVGRQDHTYDARERPGGKMF